MDRWGRQLGELETPQGLRRLGWLFAATCRSVWRRRWQILAVYRCDAAVAWAREVRGGGAARRGAARWAAAGRLKNRARQKLLRVNMPLKG